MLQFADLIELLQGETLQLGHFKIFKHQLADGFVLMNSLTIISKLDYVRCQFICPER